MRWIVYLLGLCLIVGGLGVIGLSIDLQGIERGTTLAISGTVALTGGVVTLAIAAAIGKIESLTAALAPAPTIPALNLPPHPLEPQTPAPAQAPAFDDAPRPGPSAGSIGGAAGAAALAASAYAYREAQAEPERAPTSEPDAVAEAPLRPTLAVQAQPEPEPEPLTFEPAPVETAPPVSPKTMEFAEDRAESAAEPVESEEPAADREALIEAAIRHDQAAHEEAPAIAPDIEERWDEPASLPVVEAALETPVVAEVAEPQSDEIAPVEADETREPDAFVEAPAGPGPTEEAVAEASVSPESAPDESARDAAPGAPDPLAWLDRTLSDPPAPPEPPAAPPPPPPKPAPSVVGRYTSGGVNYTMYSDQSIEAETPTETIRFASMRELKAFIEGRTSGQA